MDTLKRCCYCKQGKPPSDFFVDRSTRDGLNPACKPCIVARVRSYQERLAQREITPVDIDPLHPKRCSRCKEIKARSEFPRNKRRTDGVGLSCKTCENRRIGQQHKTPSGREVTRAAAKRFREGNGRDYQIAYWQSERGKEVQRAYRARNKALGKIKARDRARRALLAGKIAAPDGGLCQLCGTAPWKHLHHHLGYAEEHYLDVQFLCHGCHGRVSRLATQP